MSVSVTATSQHATSLADDLDVALAGGPWGPLEAVPPMDRRDRFLTLLRVYDLHTAPVQVLGDAVRFQGHPAVADLKSRLEAEWLVELEHVWAERDRPLLADTPQAAVSAMRVVAARERLPQAYRWLAEAADWEQVVNFLALEGGPDGGFDDLVACCQIGLAGSAKLELAQNYWDEMGNGDPEAVHTVLHDRLVEALQLPQVARADLPVAALERAALGGLLATNRWLQPELLGALGLLELQAGPRCRLVLQAFDRLGAPPAAYPFYVEHAEVDPRHGKNWVELAIAPLVADTPEWGARIIKGAWWRSTVNVAFFQSVQHDLSGVTQQRRTVAA